MCECCGQIEGEGAGDVGKTGLPLVLCITVVVKCYHIGYGAAQVSVLIIILGGEVGVNDNLLSGSHLIAEYNLNVL